MTNWELRIFVASVDGYGKWPGLGESRDWLAGCVVVVINLTGFKPGLESESATREVEATTTTAAAVAVATTSEENGRCG